MPRSIWTRKYSCNAPLTHFVHVSSNCGFASDLNDELEAMKQLLKEIVKRITDNLLGKSCNSSETGRQSRMTNNESQSVGTLQRPRHFVGLILGSIECTIGAIIAMQSCRDDGSVQETAECSGHGNLREQITENEQSR